MMYYRKLHSVILLRGCSMQACAHACRMDQKTFRAKMYGRSDWRLREMLALREFLQVERLPLEVLYKPTRVVAEKEPCADGRPRCGCLAVQGVGGR